VTDLYRRAYSIKRVLSPFFHEDEIGDFRLVQATTGAIISGSAALQFFNRECYDTDNHSSDLDTYCHLSRCIDVGNWISSKGYVFQPKQNQLPSFFDDWNRVCNSSSNVVVHNTHDYPARFFVAVWNFVRAGKTIQIIAVRGSLVGAVLSFHSTCVMNIITHCAAYCLFAKPTLIDRTSFAFNGRLTHTHSIALCQKWINRGFTISHCPSVKDVVCLSSGVSVRHFRWVGDTACRKMYLEYSPGCTDRDFMESNSWDIHYRKPYPAIESDIFQPIRSLPGVVVARRERTELARRYRMLSPSIRAGLLR
ncbi:hypothetical protein F5878DRAFT_544219, partial [Lentinula raphanica]